MDPLEIEYDSIDAVPEAFRSLYEMKGDKAVLTKVNGLKTQRDVANVQDALRKEREDHGKVRDALKGWKSLGDDPTVVQTQIDRIAELEAAAGGKLDEAGIAKLVDARLAQRTAPLQRELETIRVERDDLAKINDSLKGSMVSRDRNDVIRTIATEMNVLATAIPDVEMLAANYLERDDVSGQFIVKADVKGVTPGSDVRGFLKEMQKHRPHWWPASEGGGAGGGGFGRDGGDNPWSEKGWNLTAQGAYIRQHGQAEAERAAKAANSKIGATRPTKSK